MNRFAGAGKSRSFKRAVRRRMGETGEKYTDARIALLEEGAGNRTGGAPVLGGTIDDPEGAPPGTRPQRRRRVAP